MTIEGRTDWIGGDPAVVRFTDNGKRKVVIRLAGDLSIDAEVSDVEKLIHDLEKARIWVREG